MWKEFKAFLIKQNALALAIAVVVGAALDTVVKSIVADIIMPIAGAITPSGNWQKLTVPAGPVRFGVGNLAASILNFLIVGFVAWRLTKALIRQPRTSAAEAATKTCPFCRMTIDAGATRCPHCTSGLGVQAA